MRLGKTSSLLAKASAQLRGERVSVSAEKQEKDDVGAYLKSMRKKSNADVDWAKLAEQADISDEDTNNLKLDAPSNTGSKFLKKKTAEATIKNAESSQKPQKGKQDYVASNRTGILAKSSALSKAAAFTSKQNLQTKTEIYLSDSDLDMDISLDEDILKDANIIKKSSDKKLQQSADLNSNKKLIKKWEKKTFAVSDDEDLSSSFGKGGNKFLKKKPEVSKYIEPQSEQKKVGKEQKSFKSEFSVALDSDEELSSMSARTPRAHSPPSSRKQAFIKAKLKPSDVTSLSPDVMEDIKEEEEQREYSDSSSEDDFKFNIMGMDELDSMLLSQPSKSEKRRKSADKISKTSKAKRKESAHDVLYAMGVQTVEDLLGNATDEESDIGEHIQSDMYESDEILTARSNRNGQPLRSILSPSPRVSGTPKSARGRVRLSLGDVTEIRSRSPSPEEIPTAGISSRKYSEDFDSGSEIAYSVRTEGADSDIETIATQSHYSRSASPIRSGRSSYNSYYSDEFNSDSEIPGKVHRRRSSAYSYTSFSDFPTKDYSSYSESLSPRSSTSSPERRRAKTKNVEIQTEAEPGLLYHWNIDGTNYAGMKPPIGMEYVDPTPIASHVVSPEALETLTSYSPSMLLLNGMLREQLRMTRQYIESYKYMHRVSVRNIEPEYQYTTLEDTKKYIEKHRKPILTFDEALKQVQAEMGLSTS